VFFVVYIRGCRSASESQPEYNDPSEERTPRCGWLSCVYVLGGAWKLVRLELSISLFELQIHVTYSLSFQTDFIPTPTLTTLYKRSNGYGCRYTLRLGQPTLLETTSCDPANAPAVPSSSQYPTDICVNRQVRMLGKQVRYITRTRRDQVHSLIPSYEHSY
jgi:hypothetical protein